MLNAQTYYLTEGAIAERLKNEYRIKLNPHVNHGALVLHAEGRALLQRLYMQYAEIAYRHGLPILLMTPTRRVNSESCKAAGLNFLGLIEQNYVLLKDVQSKYQEKGGTVLIGGLLGCKGDAYSPEGHLDVPDAASFYQTTVQGFQPYGFDFLFAGIMPTAGEAQASAQAMAGSGIQYITSFMLTQSGSLLDGTSLHQVIHLIEESVYPRPFCYMANCIHPSLLRLALEQPNNQTKLVRARLKGIQSNGSALPTENLNNAHCTLNEGLSSLREQTDALLRAHDFTIVGGCCGTDDKYLTIVADLILKRRMT